MTDEPRIRRPTETEEFYFKEGCHILEILNDPADPDLSLARARVAPGTRTRLHRLRGITERYFILRGTGAAEIGGRAPTELRPGDVATIPPDCDQRITNTGEEELVFLALCTPRFRSDAYSDTDPAVDE